MNSTPSTMPRHKKPSRPPAAIGARVQAHRLLNEVLGQRQTLDEALAKHPLTGAEADQRFVMRLVLTSLQHLGQVDTVLARYLEKPLPAKRHEVMNALRLGVVQLLLLHTPAHAAINETVMLVKKGKDAGFAALVNALLQKIARDQPELPAPESNLPPWLRTRWEAAYGVAAVATMAQVAAQRAPLDIQCAQPMEGAVRLDAQMLRFVGEHPPVEQLPGYETGAFFVQDVAASYPVRMAGDLRERQVLDVCAAPGGKAMQLIQAGAFVTALDRSAARMKRLKANLARMGMQANTVVADALEWQPNRAYDVILLDAPCSATGTWRRHPEVVQLVTPEHIAEMVALQRALLSRVWGWLKPGGRMVYCVCSLEPEEGEQQAAWFGQQQADAQVATGDAASTVPAHCLTSEGYLRTRPDMCAEQGGMDGFFAVCFTKR
ncbi:MAG: transcription antitermination factor NusB [Alphaproteobacteria bacterium]|nr:transcription antitermination factor NusB [Alphaproteobacteria bacterium]